MNTVCWYGLSFSINEVKARTWTGSPVDQTTTSLLIQGNMCIVTLIGENKDIIANVFSFWNVLLKLGEVDLDSGIKWTWRWVLHCIRMGNIVSVAEIKFSYHGNGK